MCLACNKPLGEGALDATPANIKRAIQTVKGFKAGGGNGGEASCLKALRAMNLDVVFFLGDGG